MPTSADSEPASSVGLCLPRRHPSEAPGISATPLKPLTCRFYARAEVARAMARRPAELSAGGANYFPMLIPSSYLSREAGHVEGFARSSPS